MTVSVSGPTAAARRLTLWRAIEIVSPTTTLGAVIWRQGFLYVIEWRIVSTELLRSPHRSTRQHAIRDAPVERETASGLATAIERFGQIVDEQPAGLAPSRMYVRPESLDDGTLAHAVLAGSEPAPDNLAMAELVQQMYPIASGPAREAILSFVRQTQLTWGYWAGWKWLYKQAEATADIELLAAAIGRLRSTPAWLQPDDPSPIPFIDRYPSPQTVRYLLRRMARFERKLAANDPDAQERLRQELERARTNTETDEKSADIDHASILAELVAGIPGAADTVGNLFWSSDPESRKSLLAIVRERAITDINQAIPLVQSIARWMPVAVHDSELPDRRLALIDLLGELFDTPQPEDTRITIAGCIWQVDDASLHQRARAALMQAENAHLPAWVSALRAAAPPDLPTTLADVEARIRFTVWDPADVRLLAPLMKSLDAPDLFERVVDLAPDTFQTDGMGLSEMFNHDIPKVAEWARQQAAESGLTGAEILRLIESRRQADVATLIGAVGKLPATDLNLLRCVRRLLTDDRPRLRRLAVPLVRAHRGSLPARPVIAALAASPDREARSLALDLLEQEPAVIADVPGLVVAALTERWATPQQRAAITQQIEAAPRQSQAVVLAIARNGYPLQREWALRILIDLAQDGVEVPGVELIELQEAGR